jgi:hypothetical protein
VVLAKAGMDDVTPVCIMALDRSLRPVSAARGLVVGTWSA